MRIVAFICYALLFGLGLFGLTANAMLLSGAEPLPHEIEFAIFISSILGWVVSLLLCLAGGLGCSYILAYRAPRKRRPIVTVYPASQRAKAIAKQ